MVPHSVIESDGLIVKDSERTYSKREFLQLALASTTAVLSASVVGCKGNAAANTLRMSGSNTVFRYAVELAKKYRERHAEVSFRITGDGTSRGIKFAGEGEIQGLPADFMNRNRFAAPLPASDVPQIADSMNGERMDIGLSSRDLLRSEREAYSTINVVTFAYDGIAVVTNRAVLVPNLTLQQLRDIYAGTITNWMMVGGPNAPIVVIARDALSGTAQAWDELVMGGLPVVASAMNVAQADDVPAKVAMTPNSIAYLSLAQIDPQAMNPVNIEGVAPTVEQVGLGRYPIKRPFVFVTGSAPTLLQRGFLDFSFSAEAQQIITMLGAVPAAVMS